MFESCNTLQELNKARSDAIRSGMRPQEVNSAYNAKRKEVMLVNPAFKQINIIRPDQSQVQPVMYLPYAGQSGKTNTITITGKGVLC